MGSVICDQHWETNFATTKIFGKEKPQHPPSVFKGVPKIPSQLPFHALCEQFVKFLLLQQICTVMSYLDLNQRKYPFLQCISPLMTEIIMPSHFER